MFSYRTGKSPTMNDTRGVMASNAWWKSVTKTTTTTTNTQSVGCVFFYNKHQKKKKKKKGCTTVVQLVRQHVAASVRTGGV
jgi:ABC-type dipeptide/oligopeptide/nickel transport system ATPase subunit